MTTAKELYDSLLNEDSGPGINVPWDKSKEDALAEIIVFFVRIEPYSGLLSDNPDLEGILHTVSKHYPDHPTLVDWIQKYYRQKIGEPLVFEESLTRYMNSAIAAFLYLHSISGDESQRLIETLRECKSGFNRKVEIWDKFLGFLEFLREDAGALRHSRSLIE